jgi:hypothetical protein
MALALGIVALAIVVVGVVVAIVFAGRQADEEAAPKSEPGDFVAPVSSGGHAFRQPDESPEEFKERVQRLSDRPKV